jgi:hypothetical protein
MDSQIIIALFGVLLFVGAIIFIRRERRRVEHRLRDCDQLKESALRALKAQQR